jgi:hypothetical protein
MKSLIKLAMGAAIAGAAVSLLMKRRSRHRPEERALKAAAEEAGHGAAGFTVGELIAARQDAAGMNRAS